MGIAAGGNRIRRYINSFPSGRPHLFHPPSTKSVWPVMPPASSEARKHTADATSPVGNIPLHWGDGHDGAFVDHFFGYALLHHFGIYKTRGYRVHPNVVAAPLGTQRAHQPVYRGLGYAVGRTLGGEPLGVARRYAHYRPAAIFHHIFCRGLRRYEVRFNVEVHDLVEFVLAQVENFFAYGRADVVYEYVEAAVPAVDVFYHIADVRGFVHIHQVAVCKEALALHGGHSGIQRGGVIVGDTHNGAFGGQPFGDGPSYALGSACHKRGFFFYTIHL